jgi:hypothetical protein
MAFDMSTRTRAKQAQAAAKLLDPSTTHIDYVAARGHARWAPQTIVYLSIFVVAFLIALVMGYVVLPGGILGIYAYYSALPPRGVVIADQGVAVLARSFWNSRPNRVITLLTHEQMAQVQAIAKGSKAEMAFGPERLTFNKKEWARFGAAVQQVSQNWMGTTRRRPAPTRTPPTSAARPRYDAHGARDARGLHRAASDPRGRHAPRRSRSSSRSDAATARRGSRRRHHRVLTSPSDRPV